MKNRNIFKIGFVSTMLFVGVAAYLWYLYFHQYEGEVLQTNVRIELVNNGGSNYIDAIPNDDEAHIPTYYFRVKNGVALPVSYEVLISDVKPSKANDGCTEETFFKREELEYELKLDNKVIKRGTLSDIKNNILNAAVVDSNSVNDYALRVWLNDKSETTLAKHYHYKISVREVL